MVESIPGSDKSIEPNIFTIRINVLLGQVVWVQRI
jgi:hypothetical protein